MRLFIYLFALWYNTLIRCQSLSFRAKVPTRIVKGIEYTVLYGIIFVSSMDSPLKHHITVCVRTLNLFIYVCRIFWTVYVHNCTVFVQR